MYHRYLPSFTTTVISIGKWKPYETWWYMVHYKYQELFPLLGWGKVQLYHTMVSNNQHRTNPFQSRRQCLLRFFHSNGRRPCNILQVKCVIWWIVSFSWWRQGRRIVRDIPPPKSNRNGTFQSQAWSETHVQLTTHDGNLQISIPTEYNLTKSTPETLPPPAEIVTNK